ncbi:MAG: CopG family transcriptional regulator [Candidatus Omnitrophica bacterium]|nr:CopG family transcriptional regulator [Candidatus Omnitrophota bacterium]
MKKKAKRDNDKPFGKLIKIDDFLPSPDKLVLPKEGVKVTMSLSKSSIDFFKEQAKLHHVKYQQMIRQLVDKYASRYTQSQ